MCADHAPPHLPSELRIQFSTSFSFRGACSRTLCFSDTFSQPPAPPIACRRRPRHRPALASRPRLKRGKGRTPPPPSRYGATPPSTRRALRGSGQLPTLLTTLLPFLALLRTLPRPPPSSSPFFFRSFYQVLTYPRHRTGSRHAHTPSKNAVRHTRHGSRAGGPRPGERALPVRGVGRRGEGRRVQPSISQIPVTSLPESLQ